MSLKPRNIDFQRTWTRLRRTVEKVVALKRVKMGDWNKHFSDVYALCVAYPEPLADRLYEETRIYLEEHVRQVLHKVRGPRPPGSPDPADGLLSRYYLAWQVYSQGVKFLNNLYSYLNLQHIKRQKVSEAELIYGSSNSVVHETDTEQLEIGNLGLSIWERILIRPLATHLSQRIVIALTDARCGRLHFSVVDILRTVVHSMVEVQAFRVCEPLSLYEDVVLRPYLAEADRAHALLAHELLEEPDVAVYLREALAGLERETGLGRLYLLGAEAVRTCFERAAVEAHLPRLHAYTQELVQEAVGDFPTSEQRREDVGRMYTLLKPLGADALKPLVEATQEQATAEGLAMLTAVSEEPHIHFVNSILALHAKYSKIILKVFDGAQAFMAALDRSCNKVVNSKTPGDQQPKAPELLARYCDCLLRKRATVESDIDDKLSAAILVFKYVDDKDVFQKFYARTLARRLIHQLSSSMEYEEVMINRLKSACGYEFTNKLNRMFTDVTLSVDLNAKFQKHIRATSQVLGVGFNVQVLQAGAWPLGGAMSPLAPPVALERPASMFEEFYKGMFNGRRLAWLHNLCTCEMRTKYTHRVYHVQATTAQCAMLLCFEHRDRGLVKDLRQELQLPVDVWTRHLRPLLENGFLECDGDPGDDTGEVALSLNLRFQSKRSRVKVLPIMCGALSTAGPSETAIVPSAASEGGAYCEDDRKMYLQAALVRIMKQRKILKHSDLIQEVVDQARTSFAPSVSMIKKCIEALIDKQYLERAPGKNDTYAYLA